MGKRGRPRHPDILTPREWEVLDLLREGLTNEQIAERLGVSFATARYHVSEILSKLGVSTREEAAAWRPEEERREWWRLAWPLTAAKAVGVALAAALLVGLGVLAWGVLGSESSNESTGAMVGAENSAGLTMFSPEVPPEEACPSALESAKRMADETAYLSTGWEAGDVICWTDIGGEVWYKVEGTVVYWSPPSPTECGATPLPDVTPFGTISSTEVSEVLPANMTRFQLPAHPDRSLSVKDYTIHIDALDTNGNVIASGASSLTKDAFCESP